MAASQIPISFIQNIGPFPGALPFIIWLNPALFPSADYVETYEGAYAVYDAINAAYYPGGDSAFNTILAGYNTLTETLTSEAAYLGGLPIYLAGLAAYDNGGTAQQIAEATYPPYISAYSTYESAINFWQTYNAAIAFALANPTMANPYSSINEIR